MATYQDVTSAPTALAGLTVGTIYRVQLVGSAAYIESASSAPAANSKSANLLQEGEWVRVRNASGEHTYIWTTAIEDGQRVVINEEIG